MDKYEYKVRADEIKALIAEGEYAQAVKIADSIDWRRVKSVMMLCTISDLYKINRRYEDSRDILLLAYARHAGGRLIVYSLCELSIKLEEYVQAIEYYKEFVQLAPKDTGRYILQYKLYEAQEVSLEERIAVLEEFKKRDYREKWAYELAYLYHRVGLESKCVEECDEMFLWFSEGKYVLKALELKKLHQPLTQEQQNKYDQIKDNGGISEPEIVSEGKAIQEEADAETEDEDDDEFSIEQNVLTDPTQEIPKKDLDDIQVKTVDVSQFNTLNLQKELAESMKEFLENNPIQEEEERQAALEKEEPEINSGARKPDVRGEAAAENMQEKAAGREKPEAAGAEVEEQDVEEPEPLSQEILVPDVARQEKPVSEEVFFGNTAEVNVEDVVSELIEKDGAAARQVRMPSAAPEPVPQQEPLAEEVAVQPEKMQQLPKADANPALGNTGIIRTFHKPSGYDDILSQEYDGQLSLVVPDEQKVEKQITGQLSISDIMAEWEKIKKENEQKMLNELKDRVHKQTNALFADFDESTKSGLLEELENAIVSAAMKEQRKKDQASRPRIVKSSQLSGKETPAEPTVREEPRKMPKEEEPGLSEEILTEPETEETQVSLEEDFFEEDESLSEIPKEREEEIPEPEDGGAEETDKGEEVSEEETADAEETADEESQSKPGAGYKSRELSKSEREQFAPFIHHKKTRRQIVEALDNISMASYTGNVIVTGEEGTGTIALAKLLVKEIQLTDNNFSGRVAKISGDTMNKKDVGATLAKLAGGALIIEKASTLKKAAAEGLAKEMNQEGRGLVVILEDAKTPMNDFLAKHEALSAIFNLRVDLEALDDQTLVKYAKKYALEQEYSIDELGVLALHTRIADMQTSDHEVTLSEIEELVDEAIYYADKKTPKHYFDVLFGKRYDREDMIVLRENDFMHY
ncbi:MAG: hypothetical protein HFI46_02630 [Lachnospiraceae bacterium]|nr:hypothetical protein [Lachnospiraceae bacterium]